MYKSWRGMYRLYWTLNVLHVLIVHERWTEGLGECTEALGECTKIQYICWRCLLNVPDHLVECTEGLDECTEVLGECTEIQYIRWRMCFECTRPLGWMYQESRKMYWGSGRMYRDSVHSLQVCFECTRPLSWMYWGECTEIQYIRWICLVNVPDP